MYSKMYTEISIRRKYNHCLSFDKNLEYQVQVENKKRWWNTFSAGGWGEDDIKISHTSQEGPLG